MISRAFTRRRTERRLLALLASALLISGTLLTAGAVLAVHDEGVFELEGNAVDGVTANDPANPQAQPPGGDDWDAVFAETDSAEATSFVTDTTVLNTLAGAGDSILSTNTKDIQEIVDWDWKQTTSTSVQDKADIENAYAAQYIVDKTGEQCGTAPGTDECVLLYFGADRFSNSGDTVMGFWFFKSNVGANPVDATGNGTFSGAHTARTATSRGDILIVADFRAGGKAPQIQIYEWVTTGGSASTHLDQIGGGASPASCTQAPPEKANGAPIPPVSGDDNFCATANQFVVTSPWPFLAKPNSGGTTGDGGSDTKFGVAEFMEGGINMTALGLGDQCFSSFMAETRASHSVTSTLSDFALGTFGSCGSGVTTTPQTGAGGAIPAAGVSIGTTARVDVRDQAVISVEGTDGPFAGTVKFFLCGPLALASGTNCSTGGVQIGLPLTGETVAGNAGTATVNSDTATLTSAGRYCWRAEYSGDSLVGVPGSVDPSKSVADGGNILECFKVNPVQPTLTTTASADTVLGQAITDTASLTGTARQPGTDGVGPGGTINATAGTQALAGGSITFTVRGPDDCDASGLTVTGSPVTVSGDNASYGPVSATPTAIGKYTFVATYDGSSPNTLGAAGTCPPAATDGDEEVTVGSSSTVTTPQRQTDAGPPPIFSNLTADTNGNGVPDVSIGANARVTVRDHAAITVNAIPTWTGTVTFSLCGPAALGSTATCTSNGVAIGAGKSVSNSTTTADSDAAVLTSVGFYCWRANFSSTTAGVPASSDSSSTECFEVLPVQPTLTTTASADTVLGQAITDTASLTGTARQPGTDGVGPGGTINATAGTQALAGGSITFTVRGPDDCDASGLTVTGSPVTVSGDNASYGPVSATPTAIGKYTFVATYDGSSPNTLGAAGTCPPAATDGDEEVTVGGSASLSTAQRWLPNDTAHVTSQAGTTLAGTLTFTLYPTNDCTGTAAFPSITRNVVTDANAGGTGNDRTVSTNNTAFIVTTANDATAWSWKVSYNDDSLSDPTDSCESTSSFTLVD